MRWKQFSDHTNEMPKLEKQQYHNSGLLAVKKYDFPLLL